MDRWELELQEASYGGLVLHVVAISDAAGTDIAAHEYPHVDGANLQSMGRRRRVTRATLIFFATSAQDDYYSRFLDLFELAHDGEPHTFVHPITGSFEALVGDFEFRATPDERDAVQVELTFEEPSTDVATFEAGAGDVPLAGIQQVDADVADLDAELAAAGLSSGIGATIKGLVAEWEDGTGRDVRLGLADLTNRIEEESDRLGLATDVSRFSTYRALVRLQYSTRKAALAVLQDSPRMLEFTVSATAPLLVVAAEIYGASEASARADQLLRLNNIRNPARIESGTVLKGQARSASRRMR